MSAREPMPSLVCFTTFSPLCAHTHVAMSNLSTHSCCNVQFEHTLMLQYIICIHTHLAKSNLSTCLCYNVPFEHTLMLQCTICHLLLRIYHVDYISAHWSVYLALPFQSQNFNRSSSHLLVIFIAISFICVAHHLKNPLFNLISCDQTTFSLA